MHPFSHFESLSLSLLGRPEKSLFRYFFFWVSGLETRAPHHKACADCPGFVAPGTAGAPAPGSFRLCLRTSIFAIEALGADSWTCCPQLPYHPCKNGTLSTSFCSTWGAHTDIFDATVMKCNARAFPFRSVSCSVV